jgi:hypothetical protein
MASAKESLALQEEQATISIYFISIFFCRNSRPVFRKSHHIVTPNEKTTRALTFENLCHSQKDYKHSSKWHGETAPSFRPDVQSSKKVP